MLANDPAVITSAHERTGAGTVGDLDEVLRTIMDHGNDQANIELGMKVSVRRSGRSLIGVITRISGDCVIVRWTNSDLGETTEYEAHRGDVTPLAGWL